MGRNLIMTDDYEPTDPTTVDPDFILDQQSTRYLNKYQYQNMLDVQSRIIGYGLKTDGMFNDRSGGVNYASGSDLINQSIKMILSTREGERFFMPSFGSRLHKLIFQPETTVLFDLISSEIKRALDLWEQRITVDNVLCSVNESSPNQVDCQIQYTLRNTNLSGNYVYPLNVNLYDMETGISGSLSKNVKSDGYQTTDPSM